MGKSDFLTPKAIANRIKAKGLQKLRWYCQMCQKQCRDENGFKCHCLSESHQRQMAVFGQNPHRVVEGFSEEFQEGFLDLMRRSHRHSRVAATVVYNEYIADRHHVHMNATKWATLTEFVTHLSRAGLCKADHTEKGWFITYIDRGSETLFKERLRMKRARADVADEDRQERAIQAQIARAVSHLASSFVDPAEDGPSDGNSNGNGNGNGNDDAPVDPPALNGKVAFSLKPLSSSKADSSNEAAAKKPPALAFEDEPEKISKKGKASNVVSGKSALDELMIEEEKVKEKKNRKDYWLCEGIVVKVLCKALADKGYYKKKGVVRKVIDTYVGEIEMLDNKHVLRVDQAELETVIPQIGGLVRIVNGAYRGSYARLLSVDVERFCAKVQIEKGVYEGRVLSAVEYEDICKVLSE